MNLLVRPSVDILFYIHIKIKCNETIKNTTLITSKVIIKKMNKMQNARLRCIFISYKLLGFEANLNNRENIIYL